MSSPAKDVAVIFSGAVANAAFEAGALEVLAHQGLSITRVLGTSSGALNATLFARYLLAGDQKAGAKALVDLWLRDATWWQVFRPSWRGLVTLTGLSNQNGILAVLRKHIEPVTVAKAELDLCLVVTSLDGLRGDIGGAPATTHEGVCHFGKSDFASEDRLSRVFETAVASAAFPGVFVPVQVPGLGPCSDGGIVNNTPFKHVLGGDVGRVVVIVPAPRVSHDEVPKDIGALVGRIADAIVDERLYRDLRKAEQVNTRLAALESLGTSSADKSLLYEAKLAAGLGGTRRLEILEIRPEKALPNPFCGFFSRILRKELIDSGRAAAHKALRVKGWAPVTTD
jgi:predicted acylesterase/phospholipase RssA